MEEKLDLIDAKILEGLGIYGPRDLTSLSKELSLNRGTVWKRVKRLSSLFLLKFHANIYHTYAGLKKAVVLAWATPGQESLLFDCLYLNDFCNYISRCYGTSEGCYGVFVIPRNHTSEFRQFLQEIEQLGVARRLRVLWSTCFQNVNLTSTWFDTRSETWVFPWDEWIKELVHENKKLPYTLVDPPNFPIKVDEIDLFILKELEKDATISFVSIAKKLNVTRQMIEYHYRNHILRRGLIEDIQVAVAPFDRKGMSEALFFHFKFEDEESMANFALSLLDKPFAHTLGKVLNEKALVAYLHFLSRKDFRGFVNALSKVVKMGFLKDYNYAFLDLEKTTRETIRYEFFKDGTWIYEHDKHMKNLRDLVSKANTI